MYIYIYTYTYTYIYIYIFIYIYVYIYIYPRSPKATYRLHGRIWRSAPRPPPPVLPRRNCSTRSASSGPSKRPTHRSVVFYMSYAQFLFVYLSCLTTHTTRAERSRETVLTKLKEMGRTNKKNQSRSRVRFGRLPKGTYRPQ